MRNKCVSADVRATDTRSGAFFVLHPVWAYFPINGCFLTAVHALPRVSWERSEQLCRASTAWYSRSPASAWPRGQVFGSSKDHLSRTHGLISPKVRFSRMNLHFYQFECRQHTGVRGRHANPVKFSFTKDRLISRPSDTDLSIRLKCAVRHQLDLFFFI